MSDGMGRRRVRDGAGDRDDVEIVIDGEALRVRRGESVLAALLAHGHVAISKDVAGRVSGAYCGMGVCFACNVAVDGVKRRACAITVQAGMSIRTRVSLADLLIEWRIDADHGGARGLR